MPRFALKSRPNRPASLPPITLLFSRQTWDTAKERAWEQWRAGKGTADEASQSGRARQGHVGSAGATVPCFLVSAPLLLHALPCCATHMW